MTDDYNAAAFAFIAALRGGVPLACDFCEKPYKEGERWPIPEEAGEWACNECLAQWRKDGVPGYAG